MSVLVTLACGHYLWPTGRTPQVGDVAYCVTCRRELQVWTVGRTEW